MKNRVDSSHLPASRKVKFEEMEENDSASEDVSGYDLSLFSMYTFEI